VAYIEREDGMMRIGFSAQAEALTNFVDATGYTLSELITAIERDVKSAIAVSLDKETFKSGRMKYPNLKALVDQGYTELELTIALSTTFHELRKEKHAQSVPLDKHCRELIEEVLMLGDDLTSVQAAKKWRVSESTIKQARYTKFKHRKTESVDDADISRLRYEGLTPREISLELHTTVKLVQERLIALGLIRTELSTDQLNKLTEMAEDGFTQSEVASELGVSQPTVHRHWPFRLRVGKYQARKSKKEWEEILREAKKPDANISEICRDYKVSRGSLYNKLKKEK